MNYQITTLLILVLSVPHCALLHRFRLQRQFLLLNCLKRVHCVRTRLVVIRGSLFGHLASVVLVRWSLLRNFASVVLVVVGSVGGLGCVAGA